MDERGLLDLMIGRIPGLYPRDRIKLAKEFDREMDLSVLSMQDIEYCLGRPLRYNAIAMDEIRFQAEQDEKAARLKGIAYVSYCSPQYPPLLREIADPPVLLFFRGQLPDPEKPVLAVVGTRNASGPAAAQAYDISRTAGFAEIPVVSGLALGIDAMAHRGNLEGNAPTIAVLGSGLDGVYPSSNRLLAGRIVENGGVLFSEYAPGTLPQKWHFPARNRIISGLARGTLIVEAPESSGALITAQFALDQGRDLWVASSGIYSPIGEGTRKLAEQGAKVISDVNTILEEWSMDEYTAGEEKHPFSGTVLAQSMARSLNLDL